MSYKSTEISFVLFKSNGILNVIKKKCNMILMQGSKLPFDLNSNLKGGQVTKMTYKVASFSKKVGNTGSSGYCVFCPCRWQTVCV